LARITSKTKKKILYAVGFTLTVAVIALLLFFFLKDTIFELRRLTMDHDEDGIKEFLRSKGWWGYVTVVIVEALEMLVICIPAEFIQFPAGISFPFYIAIPLCDAGVMLGASVIYLLVHTFKMDPPLQGKREKKLESIEKTAGDVKIQMLMYFLFVTPIIPFGAICYYCSSKKISYGKYLFTVATGVLPSIITSIIMGSGARYFIAHDISVWFFVLLVFLLGTVLFIGMFFIGRKFIYKKENKNTPNSILYRPLLNVFGLFVGLHSKPAYVEDALYEEMLDINGPIVFLCNHKSVYDIYHTFNYIYPLRAALVGNRYYLRNKVTRFAIHTLGFIPKRMFAQEIEPIKKILAAVKNGTSVFIYPEARLSLDGLANPITEGTGALLKRLAVPVVVLNINGDFTAYSKFHTTKGRIPVEVKVNRILYPDEIKALDEKTLNDILQSAVETNEYAYMKRFTVKDKNMASGSEKVIYKCPQCRNDYTVQACGCTLQCDCGFTLTFDEHYSFKPNAFGFANLSDAYRYVKKIEKEDVFGIESDVKFTVDVTVKILDAVNPKNDLPGSGTVTLTTNGIQFTGIINGEAQSFAHTFRETPCLVFGVDSEFEFYHQGKLYYFYPVGNRRACTKMATLYDVLVEAYKNKKDA